MSRRGSRARILVDTSFLLPVLGYETSRRVMEAWPLLAGHELHYSELSILEALWKISKRLAALDDEERVEALKRVREGLDAIGSGMLRAETTPAAAEKALEMYIMGHKDMIDNLLYATAEEAGLLFLTVDNSLISFLKSHGLPADHVVTPEELGSVARGTRRARERRL